MNNISRNITAVTTTTTPAGGRPVVYLGDNNLS